MHHLVYILQNKKGHLYIGYTIDIKRRLSEHNCGKSFSTKSKLPWKLIFAEIYLDKEDARRREKYLKTSQGSMVIKRMPKEYFYKLKSKNN